MKIPKIKEDESLAMWQARLANEFNLDYKMQELIREVSVTSYIYGTNMILDTLKKEGIMDECDWIPIGNYHYCQNRWTRDDDDNIVTTDGRK